MLKRTLSIVMVFAILVSLFAGLSCTSAATYPTLRKGSRNEAVGEVQHMYNVLNETGFISLDAPLKEDGVFGDLTKKATIIFQRAYDLEPDGVVGSKTWKKLLEVYAEATEEADPSSAASITVRGLTVPGSLYQYETYELEGKVKFEKGKVKKLWVGLYDLAGGRVDAKSYSVANVSSFDLSEVNEDIALTEQKPQEYLFMILADTGSGRGLEEIVCQELEILDYYVDSPFEETENTILRLPKKEFKNKISKNFRVSEMACKDGSDYLLVSRKLIAGLEALRSELGDAAITITSGFRTPEYNATLEGSASNSRHCLGLAADISVSGHTPFEVAQAAEILGFSGIGYYPSGQGYFTHADVREGSAYFWKDVGDYLATVSSFN